MTTKASFEFRTAVPAPKMCAAEEIFRNGSFKTSAASASVPSKISVHGGSPSSLNVGVSSCEDRSSWDEYARLSFAEEEEEQEEAALLHDSSARSSKSARKWSIKQLLLPRCITAVEAKLKLARDPSQSQKVCSAVLPHKSHSSRVGSHDSQASISNKSQNERPTRIFSIGSANGKKRQKMGVVGSFSSKSFSSQNQCCQAPQNKRSSGFKDQPPEMLLRRKTFLPYKQTILPLLSLVCDKDVKRTAISLL